MLNQVTAALSSGGMSVRPDGRSGAAWPCFPAPASWLLSLPRCQSRRSPHTPWQAEGGLPRPTSPARGKMSSSLCLAAGFMEEERSNTKEKFQCAAEFCITEGEGRRGARRGCPRCARCERGCAEQPRAAESSPCSFPQERQCG